MSVETAQWLTQTGVLQELAREIGKASIVTDRNGHVWQVIVGARERTCTRCGQIDYYGSGRRVDDGVEVFGWLTRLEGDGYCAEIAGKAAPQ